MRDGAPLAATSTYRYLPCTHKFGENSWREMLLQGFWRDGQQRTPQDEMHRSPPWEPIPQTEPCLLRPVLYGFHAGFRGWGVCFFREETTQLGWRGHSSGCLHTSQTPSSPKTHSPWFNSPTEPQTELNSIRSISYPFPYKPLLRLYVTQLSPIQNYCI